MPLICTPHNEKPGKIIKRPPKLDKDETVATEYNHARIRPIYEDVKKITSKW